MPPYAYPTRAHTLCIHFLAGRSPWVHIRVTTSLTLYMIQCNVVDQRGMHNLKHIYIHFPVIVCKYAVIIKLFHCVQSRMYICRFNDHMFRNCIPSEFEHRCIKSSSTCMMPRANLNLYSHSRQFAYACSFKRTFAFKGGAELDAQTTSTVTTSCKTRRQ